MSFLVKLPEKSHEFLDYVMRIVASDKLSVAIDALLTNVAGLEEATERVQRRLLKLRHDVGPADCRLLSNECWAVLDGMHRVFALAKHLDMRLNPKHQENLDVLAQARNSFHHVEDRIEHFFSQKQGPVYGNLAWRDRVSLDEPSKGKFFMAVVFGQGDTALKHGLINPSPDYENEIGVYDLRIQYMEDGPKGNRPKPIELQVDPLAGLINELVDQLVLTHKHYLKKAAENGVEISGSKSIGPLLIVTD